MGRRRAKSLFEDDNPFIDGFLEWMDAPEGQQSIEALDLVFDALGPAGVDAEAALGVGRAQAGDDGAGSGIVYRVAAVAPLGGQAAPAATERLDLFDPGYPFNRT